jgi:hypothetical protein
MFCTNEYQNLSKSLSDKRHSNRKPVLSSEEGLNPAMGTIREKFCFEYGCWIAKDFLNIG